MPEDVFGGPTFGGVDETKLTANQKRSASMRKRWAEKEYRQRGTELNRKQHEKKR